MSYGGSGLNYTRLATALELGACWVIAPCIDIRDEERIKSLLGLPEGFKAVSIIAIGHPLEKAFWDERGKGARFRTTLVGREYFTNKFLPLIDSAELDHILLVVEDTLKEEGIAASVSHDQDGRLLRIRVEGCVHRPVEERMLAHNVEPFTCVPANLIVLAIEEKLDKPVELAEIKLEEGACQLLLVVFDQRPTLD